MKKSKHISKQINGKTSDDLDWLLGGGEMGALIRAHDWSASPIGLPKAWPQSLRTALSIHIPLGTAHLNASQLGGKRQISSTEIRADAFVEEALRWLPDDKSSRETRQLAESEKGASFVIVLPMLVTSKQINGITL